ncbi:PrgI family protein [Dactylosporangium aurantiacum]|uniref:PrgI family protein n=1 Tax=Dactylosporangium aurantiacum TaxID=35754 RepID=A0A9Q9IMQ0_9ACTN|nr:PrgI family protein [Dactylosporangium aurantiacum]MDG6108793.1 PrgI family protein [Dactylosporangium aurantiacum]UWZ55800.1 PrgI family protein [Dactylosporangium aurantiacum]
MTDDTTPRAVVPANVNEPDRIAFGLTFRQLAIIGGVGLGGFAVYRTFGHLLPPVVWIVAGIVGCCVAVVVALGRRDGLPLDVWLRHGVALSRSPSTLTPGAARATSVAVVAGKPSIPAPLRSPVTSVSSTGVLTSEDSKKVLIACGTTNIHLRTGGEQGALLDGFGRFLNSLTGPAQIVVAAQRHDLTAHAQAIADNAPRLPHPALQAAADDYAEFLLNLDTERDPLRRQVLAVVTGEHVADTAVRALSGLGVEAVALDGPAVTSALANAVDPYSPAVPGPRAVPGTPITLRSPT